MVPAPRKVVWKAKWPVTDSVPNDKNKFFLKVTHTHTHLYIYILLVICLNMELG